MANKNKRSSSQQSQKAKTTKKSQSRAVGAAQARAPPPGQGQSRNARRRRAQKERWNLDFKGVNLGGLGWGGFKLGSRTAGGTVGLSEYAPPPLKQPRFVRTRAGPAGAIDDMEGTERIAQVSTDGLGAAEGDILARILINPSVFVQTRLKQWAGLYQRYTFNRAIIRFQADANATQSGSLVGYVDYDVDNLLLNDDPLNVQKAAAHFAERPTKIWESRDFPMGKVDEFTNYFINTTQGTENRLVYQGVFYLIAATDLPANSAIGTLYFDYEVAFSIPALENVEDDFYFQLALEGDSDGSSSAPFGGAVVPWTGQGYPVNNVVYSFVGAATELLTMSDVKPGLYQLRSEWQGTLSSASGTYTVSTTWAITNGSSGIVEFVANNGQSLTQTNFNGTLGTATSASLVRNNFTALVRVTEFLPALTLTPSTNTVGGSTVYGTNRFHFVWNRVPEPESTIAAAPGREVRRSRILRECRKGGAYASPVLALHGSPKNNTQKEKSIIGRSSIDEPVAGHEKSFREPKGDKERCVCGRCDECVACHRRFAAMTGRKKYRTTTIRGGKETCLVPDVTSDTDSDGQ